MAKKFLTDIDLNLNEIQNIVVQCLASAPAGVMGQIYYNTNDHKLYQHNGSIWKPVGDTSGAAIQITEEAGSGATFKSYTIYQGGVALSPKINIPKDFLVRGAEIKTVTTTNVPYQDAAIGDKYIDFVINTKSDNPSVVTDEHLYLPINDLAHVYTAGNGIVISAGDAISITIDSNNANGLAVTAAGLKLNLASATAAGAMSGSDKSNLDALVAASATQTHRYKVSSPGLTPSGGICTWTISSSSFGNKDGTFAVCSIRDKNGYEVIADIQYAQGSVTIKFNSTANVPVSNLTAIIIV